MKNQNQPKFASTALENSAGVNTPKFFSMNFAMACRALAMDGHLVSGGVFELSNALKEVSRQKDASKPKTSVIVIATEGDSKNIIPDENEKEVPIIQRVDQAALNSIVDTFEKEGRDVLVELDHTSMFPERSTEAAGWIKEMYLSPEGNAVMANVEWTPMGVEKLQGKNYRYHSPVYLGPVVKDGEDLVMPIESISSVALTNTPNLKSLGDVLLNRSRLSTSTHSESEDSFMKATLANLLGLDPSVSDETIVEKVTALNSANKKVTQLEKQVADLQTEALNSDMERFESVLKTDEEKEEFKVMHAANRKNTVSVYSRLLASSESKPPQAPATPASPAPAEKRQPQYQAANSQQPAGTVLEDKPSEFSDPSLVAAANALITEGKETDLIAAYNRAKAGARG